MTCSHRIYLVEDTHEMGTAISCLLCGSSGDLTEEEALDFLPFQHVSPDGPDADVVILVGREVFDG